jgi:hypothetical protein
MIEKSGDWCDIAENMGSTEWYCGVMGKKDELAKSNYSLQGIIVVDVGEGKIVA